MFRLLKPYFFIALLVGLQYRTNSQSLNDTDSLKKVLNKTKADTIELKKYLKLIDTLSTEYIEPIEIIDDWIIKKSIEKNYQKILTDAYYQRGKLYLTTLNIAGATEYFNKTIEVAEKNNDYETQIKALEGLVSNFRYTQNNDKAIECLKKSIEVSEKYNYKQGIGSGKFSLGQMMKDYGYPKSKDTLMLRVRLINEAITIFKELKDTGRITASYLGMAQNYATYKLYDSALDVFAIIEPFYLNSFNKKYLVQFYFFKGRTLFLRANDNSDASEDFILNATNKLDLLDAAKYFNQSLVLANEFNDNLFRMRCYDWLAYTYEELKDFKNAYNYRTLWSNINDSLGGEENLKNMADIQHKYERERKDNKILILDSSNKQKSTLNKFLIGSTIALIGLGLLGYRNFTNNKKIANQQQLLQRQKITELENEKKLLAVDAMLKGQEEERSRIAKDLHDGLGGMLSGVKMSFMNMKENMIMSADSVRIFEKSISQLDTTIAELRKVAHNLMPEALAKFGLNDAINDFCNTIESATQIKVVYEHLGEDRIFENTTNVYLYRIIQELINNAVKHANPTEILVQLSTSIEKILLTVEDNGSGIDAVKLAASNGIGISNIKHRVHYLKGKIDYDIKSPNGTVINIEVNV